MNPLGVGIFIFFIICLPIQSSIFFYSNPLNSWSIKAKGHLYRAPKVAMSAQEVQINGCNLN